MKRNFKKAVLILAAVLMVITTFTACNMGLPWDNALWGTWTAGDTTITITNTTIDFDNPDAWNWDYSGEVVKYDNSSYNIAAENPTDGNFGYMIIKITAHEGDSSQVDTYTILRWKDLTTADGVTTVDYSEAYPAKFSSAEEAETDADADYFASFSSMTKSE